MDFPNFPVTPEELFHLEELYQLPKRMGAPPRWAPPAEPEDCFAKLIELGRLRAAGVEEQTSRVASEPIETHIRLSKRVPTSKVETNTMGWTIERNERGEIIRAYAKGVTIPSR
jgi:hypothetical protein